MLYVCIRGWKIPVRCMVTLSYYMLLYTLCEYILNHMPCFIFALDFSCEQYSRVISEHNPFKPFKPFLGIWLSRKRRRPNGWSCCSASETVRANAEMCRRRADVLCEFHRIKMNQILFNATDGTNANAAIGFMDYTGSSKPITPLKTRFHQTAEAQLHTRRSTDSSGSR